MSTPSTVTAVIPPHHQYYPHHRACQPATASYPYGSSLSNGSTRIVVNPQPSKYSGSNFSSEIRKATNQQLKRLYRVDSSVGSIRGSPSMTASDRSIRKPDWAEFYKHGIPKEVIVIDDDSPPAPHVVTKEHDRSRHVDKRRKTGPSSVYDPVYHPDVSFSMTQTPYHDHSSSNNTISTDRTTSVNITTAATSLGSQVSNGSYKRPLDVGVIDQKRKRTRRAAAEEAEETKRREVETRGDPFTNYIPPPNPPIKAKDIHVPLISDHHNKDQIVDDEDGHYVVTAEADLTNRYQVIKLLGQGTFGKVVEAYDRKKGTKCAVKIIRSIQKYRDASRIELRVLSTLSSNDRHNRNRCIHLRDCFDFCNHICIVTDLYGQSVFDFLKANHYVPFPSTHIQGFARQLFTSVAFLHDLKLIHTDLKPENILLVQNNYQTFTYNRSIPSSSEGTRRTAKFRKVLLDTEIRLIDFGSATFDEEYHSSVVSTRHYRAPEIILNLGWSFPCDIWSIGCILVEFFTGDALFQTHDNLEHLAMMEAVCNSKLEREIVRSVYRGSSKNPATAYFKGQKLDYPNKDTPRASRKYVREMKTLEATIQPNNDFNVKFLDLLKKIFVYNPAKRITAKEALRHPWFREILQDDGTEATKIRIQRDQILHRGERYS